MAEKQMSPDLTQVLHYFTLLLFLCLFVVRITVRLGSLAKITQLSMAELGFEPRQASSSLSFMLPVCGNPGPMPCPQEKDPKV